MFGRNVRFRRLQRQLSQGDLSQRLQTTATTYLSRLENGRTNPTLKQMTRVADVLGIPVHALLDPNFHSSPEGFYDGDDESNPK